MTIPRSTPGGVARNDLIDRYFAGVLDLADAKVQLASGGLTGAARFDYVHGPLQAYLIRVTKEELILQFAAGDTGLDVETTALLMARLTAGGSPLALNLHLAAPALTATEAEGAFVTEVTPLAFPLAHDAVARLHKAALLVNGFDLSAAEVTWWSLDTNASAANWPPITAFPLSPAPAAAPDQLHKMLVFQAWKHTHALATEDVIAYLDLGADAGATFGGLATELAALTGVAEPTVSGLATGYGWNSVPELLDGRKLLQLDAAVAALDRLGVNVDRATSWAAIEPDPATAESLRQTFKAKYDIPAWQTVIQPVEDRLREEKRNALVAYLTAGANGRWLDANALYGYFLIDVEMSACMLTSRLRQANRRRPAFRATLPAEYRSGPNDSLRKD